MTTIAISIDEGLVERLDQVARANGRKRTNRSEIVRRAVQEYLARLEQQVREDRERARLERNYDRLNRENAALVRMGAKP